MVLSSGSVSLTGRSRAAASPARPLSPSNLAGAAQSGARLAEIAALRPDGTRVIEQVKIPAHPVFDGAFTAIARGTLIQTADGDVAVEDLQPGDRLWTSTGEAAPVMWIGCMVVRLSTLTTDCKSLVRIMTDTFGEGRPDNFLTLGPSARVLQTPPRLRSGADAQTYLTSVNEFADGVNVIEITPPTPVTLFHLALDRHAAIRADNMVCETYHPGARGLRSLSREHRDLFLSMFPHLSHMSGFGPLAHPRAPSDQGAEPAQL